MKRWSWLPWLLQTGDAPDISRCVRAFVGRWFQPCGWGWCGMKGRWRRSAAADRAGSAAAGIALSAVCFRSSGPRGLVCAGSRNQRVETGAGKPGSKRATGRTTIEGAHEPISLAPALADFGSAIPSGRASGHHLVVYGLKARVEDGIPSARGVVDLFLPIARGNLRGGDESSCASVRMDVRSGRLGRLCWKRRHRACLLPFDPRKCGHASIRSSKLPACSTNGQRSGCLFRKSFPLAPAKARRPPPVWFSAGSRNRAKATSCRYTGDPVAPSRRSFRIQFPSADLPEAGQSRFHAHSRSRRCAVLANCSTS